jgi:DNA helicase II / ATP-dependent DNA helicase PcrA
VSEPARPIPQPDGGPWQGAARNDHLPRFSPAQLARMLGLDEPTPEQAAVVSAPLAPQAVIAGAGSGKSETMAARLVWLVANGIVRPERVLGLTFTRKAAAELASRVRIRLDALRRVGLVRPSGPVGDPGDLAGALLGDPVISTYHAYAGRLIGDHALREALEPTMRLITPAVVWQLAARVVNGYDGPMDAVDWAPVTVTAAVLDLSAELAEHLRGTGDVLAVGDWLARRYAEVTEGRRRLADQVLKTQRVREQLLPMVRALAAAKAEREVLDYGDQISIAARIAMRHPEVGAAERARYQVVLLDEFQDTSHAQLELLRALFGQGHPVTAVGDPCQSIYGWRGASAGNMKRFADSFPPKQAWRAEVRLLSTSFRNTGRILDAAAAIQHDLRAEVPEVPRLIAPPERADRGAVVCALLPTSQDEAAWVAGQVARLLALPAGTAPDGVRWPAEGARAGRDGRGEGGMGGQGELGGRKLRPSDIAVLCRKRTQFAALRDALEAEGIPVEVVGLGGLLTVPEVADIVATLRVLHSPAASDSLARTLTSPRWRVGPQDLIALGVRARVIAAQARAMTARADGSAGEIAAGGNGPVPNDDHMSRAVADFTAESGSLVEALDDLGDPEAYSEEGHARLSALAAELRALRRHVGRPLAELVTEVERVLGLDVEVAARPGTDPAAARADLDAFADAAAAFAGDASEPTLGAFLAYLTAAETEEFGLDAGQVGQTDSVKLATVHSAKGLQWPAVIVPGLSAGPRSQNFPARPVLSSRWTDNPRLLPFWLRGDAADLPRLAGLDPESMTAFQQDCRDRHLAEERRLAYVAVTRAAYWLACSGYWWGTGKLPLGPSPFLAEVAQACREGAGRVDVWAEPPADGAENPALAAPLTAFWPVPGSEAGARYQAVRDGGDLVLAARSVASASVIADDSQRYPLKMFRDHGDPEPVPSEYADLVAGWAADADLLLAERQAHRGVGQGSRVRQEGRDTDRAVPVELPRRIGVSALVTLARDPAELAAQIKRPMPRPPAPRAWRGTAFHRWLEERFGQLRLIEPDELAGAADADLVADDADLEELKARFEAGQWGQRWPAEVEVPFETRIGDRLVRGRIDAVFADSPQGGFDVVDWKTGRPPGSARDERAVAVQLAAYRLAWAALAGVPVEQVRAAFYYVRQDRTVRPADLLDARGLAALIESVPAAGAT